MTDTAIDMTATRIETTKNLYGWGAIQLDAPARGRAIQALANASA